MGVSADFFNDRERLLSERTKEVGSRDFFSEQDRLSRESIQPGDLGAGTAFKVGLSSNPELDLQMIAKAAYPDMPLDEARQRVSVVDGRPVYIDAEGEMRWADSGFANRSTGFIGEAGPAIAGGIGGAIVGTPLFGGALGAGAGEGLRRILTGAVFGEAEPTEDFARAVGFETATDLAFGKLFHMAGTKLSGARARGAKLDDLKPEDISKLQADILQKTGIQVDLAQVTGRASIANLRDWSARFPNEAADIMRGLTQLQSEQSQAAAQTIMDAVIKQGDRETLGRNVKNAADAAIHAAKMQRQAITRPLYEAAFNTGQVIDVSAVAKNLDDLVANSKGPIKRALSSARSMFNTTIETLDDAGETISREVLDDSVQGLHNTQRALQALIEGAGDTPLSAEIRGTLTGIRADLVNELNAQSPIYAAATRRYAQESARLVDPLRDGVIGTLSKLDQKAARAGSLLLTGRQVTPSQVRVARTAIEAQDPEAWNSALRLFLDDAFEKAATETQGASIRNFAGKFRQSVYGSPRQRAVMREAMGANTFSVFEDTMKAFEMVANLPVVGSNTARDQLITRANEGVGVAAYRFFRQMGTNVADRMGERNAGKYAIAVAEAMTDPLRINQLKELRKLSPSAERSTLILGVVLGNTVFEETALDTVQTEPQQ